MSKSLLPAVLLAALAAFPARAAKPPADKIFHENAEVSLVEVPVNVTGRDGKPVRGLTEKNFTVEDDGRRQQILSVDTIDLSQRRLASGLPSDLPAAGRRHFLLLFDFSFATPNEIARSREAAIAFVQKGMAPDDLAAVATESIERGAQILVNFTQDRAQLAAAAARVGLPAVIDRARDPLAFAFLLPGDPNAAKVTPAEVYRGGNDTEFATNAKIFQMMAQKSSDQFAKTRVERQLGGIGGLGKALDAVQGRKIIMYFSEGFDAELLYGNMFRTNEDNQADNDSMASGAMWTVDIDKRYNKTPLERRLTETMEIFRRSDCAIYPVDIAGLRDETAPDANLGHVSRGRESLFAIASATGGEVIQNSNDLEAQIKRIVERTSFIYLLSFRPSHPGDAGKFHDLKVKVDVPRAHVSARAGYYDSRSFGALSPLERVFSAADVINDAQTPGKIPLEVTALPMAGGSLETVPVIVSVPPRFFSSLPSGGALQFGIYGYVSDETGALADYFSRSISVELAKLGPALGSGGLTYLATCHLLPGKYRLRVLVRNEQSGDYGFSQSDLAVPDFSAAGFEILPPVFVDGAGDGVNIRDENRGAPAGGIFVIGDRSYAPRVSPDLAANSLARLCLVVFQKNPGAIVPFTMDAELVSGNGSSRVPAKVRLVGRTPLAADGMWKLVLELDTSGLRAGRYSLRLGVRGDGVPASETQADFTVS